MQRTVTVGGKGRRKAAADGRQNFFRNALRRAAGAAHDFEMNGGRIDFGRQLAVELREELTQHHRWVVAE